MHANLPAVRRDPTPDYLILNVVRAFPCINRRAKPWIDRATEFDPDHFHGLFVRSNQTELMCALFILNLWNTDYAQAKGWHFNLVTFMARADADSRAALIAWIKSPVWP